jgi:hypothetical protein
VRSQFRQLLNHLFQLGPVKIPRSAAYYDFVMTEGMFIPAPGPFVHSISEAPETKILAYQVLARSLNELFRVAKSFEGVNVVVGLICDGRLVEWSGDEVWRFVTMWQEACRRGSA